MRRADFIMLNKDPSLQLPVQIINHQLMGTHSLVTFVDVNGRVQRKILNSTALLGVDFDEIRQGAI